jgi:hypothetical protein
MDAFQRELAAVEALVKPMHDEASQLMRCARHGG